MESLLESLKPSLDAMNQMYHAGFEAGRAAAFQEMVPQIELLQARFNRFLKNEGADTLSKRQGD